MSHSLKIAPIRFPIINDAPVNTLPGPQSTREDVALELSHSPTKVSGSI